MSPAAGARSQQTPQNGRRTRRRPVRLLLADDHQLLRQALRTLLERERFEIVAEAADGRHALELVRRLQPDVAVLDLDLPLLDGLAATRAITRVAPRTRVLLLSTDGERHVREAIAAGARGYVLWSQPPHDLLEAIRRVRRGRLYFGAAPGGRPATTPISRRSDPFRHLSLRQLQVLDLVAAGHDVGEIAAVLGISTRTAAAHRSQMMQRLGVRRSAKAVDSAVQLGLFGV